jgi:DNA-binding XRE family transcriptional regulator
MDLSQAIKVTREEMRLTQEAVIQRGIPITQQGLSMIENGHRRVPKDLKAKFAKALPHPRVISAVMNDVTGGFGPVWLDGPNVDQHRASVHAKFEEELHEALASVEKFPIYKPPSAMTERDKKALWDHLMQVMDLYVGSWFYIAVMCMTYGVEFERVNEAHKKKLESRRYVS